MLENWCRDLPFAGFIQATSIVGLLILQRWLAAKWTPVGSKLCSDLPYLDKFLAPDDAAFMNFLVRREPARGLRQRRGRRRRRQRAFLGCGGGGGGGCEGGRASAGSGGVQRRRRSLRHSLLIGGGGSGGSGVSSSVWCRAQERWAGTSSRWG